MPFSHILLKKAVAYPTINQMINNYTITNDELYLLQISLNLFIWSHLRYIQKKTVHPLHRVQINCKKEADENNTNVDVLSIGHSLRPLWKTSFYTGILLEWYQMIPDWSRTSFSIHFIIMFIFTSLNILLSIFELVQLLLELTKKQWTIQSIAFLLPDPTWNSNYTSHFNFSYDFNNNMGCSLRTREFGTGLDVLPLWHITGAIGIWIGILFVEEHKL